MKWKNSLSKKIIENQYFNVCLIYKFEFEKVGKWLYSIIVYEKNALFIFIRIVSVYLHYLHIPIYIM